MSLNSVLTSTKKTCYFQRFFDCLWFWTHFHSPDNIIHIDDISRNMEVLLYYWKGHHIIGDLLIVKVSLWWPQQSPWQPFQFREKIISLNFTNLTLYTVTWTTIWQQFYILYPLKVYRLYRNEVLFLFILFPQLLVTRYHSQFQNDWNLHNPYHENFHPQLEQNEEYPTIIYLNLFILRTTQIINPFFSFPSKIRAILLCHQKSIRIDYKITRDYGFQLHTWVKTGH